MSQPPIETLLGEILAAVKAPRFSPVPIAEFAARVQREYLDRAKATRVKMAQTMREIAALPGMTTTGDLTTDAVSAWRVSQRQAGRSANTIRGLESYLRAACNFAVEWGQLDRAPFSRRKPLERREPARKTHHSVADMARVLEHLAGRSSESWQDHRLYALFSVYAFTGMRKLEALYLDWEDVRLPHCLMVDPRRRRLKTEASAAPVPCPAALAKVLARWQGECGSRWVFPTLNRLRPWTGGVAGTKPLDRIKAAGRACDVQGLTIESLRHTWATTAETLWGLSEPQIQRVLRHTTTSTQQHYRHRDILAMAEFARDLDYAPRKARSRNRA